VGPRAEAGDGRRDRPAATALQASGAATPATPDLYSAACQSKGGATWLQVTDIAGPGDTRPVVSETLGPAWGYHVDDVGLALGNLVRDVAGEEAAWARTHH
jgi:hypothetical protein